MLAEMFVANEHFKKANFFLQTWNKKHINMEFPTKEEDNDVSTIEVDRLSNICSTEDLLPYYMYALWGAYVSTKLGKHAPWVLS